MLVRLILIYATICTHRFTGFSFLQSAQLHRMTVWQFLAPLRIRWKTVIVDNETTLRSYKVIKKKLSIVELLSPVGRKYWTIYSHLYRLSKGILTQVDDELVTGESQC